MSRKTKPKTKGNSPTKVQMIAGWLLKLRRRVSTTTLVALVISIVFIATFISLYIYVGASTPARISGKITQFKDVTLSYDTDQESGISPLCGCMAEKKAEEWRGITFLARHVQIARSGDSPMTGYLITNALPEVTSWYPRVFKLRATVYSLSLPKTEAFDPERLIDHQLSPETKIVESKDVGIKDFLMFITDQPLNVSMLGSIPLGGWIPAKGSSVSLAHNKGIHADAYSLNNASIEENYLAYDRATVKEKSADHLEFRETIDFPLGDFLGPNVVLWSKDKSAVITAEKDVFTPNEDKDRDRYNIKAIVIGDSAFSVRIACEPFEKNEIHSYITELAPKDGKIFLPWRVRDSGKVVLTIADPRGEVPEFDQIYRYMKANPVVYVKTPTGDAEGSAQTWEDDWSFRYPPLPPNEGFNIFGPISNLTLTSALGSLMIGSRQYSVTAESSVRLSNIHSLDVEGGVISVPVQLDGKREASLQLQATSEVYVNDEALNNRLEEHKTLSTYLLFISPFISIFSLLVSVGSLIFKKRR